MLWNFSESLGNNLSLLEVRNQFANLAMFWEPMVQYFLQDLKTSGNEQQSTEMMWRKGQSLLFSSTSLNLIQGCISKGAYGTRSTITKRKKRRKFVMTWHRGVDHIRYAWMFISWKEAWQLTWLADDALTNGIISSKSFLFNNPTFVALS